MAKNKKITIAFTIIIIAIICIITATAMLLPRFITPVVPDEITDSDKADKVLKNKNIMNILICGTDKDNTRTDTIMIASYHIKDGKIYVMSVPRDTYINEKRGSKKINAAHVYGGIDLLKKDIKEYFGIEIDRYAVVNFQAFEQIVDAVGGIKYNVPPGIKYKDIYQDLDINIPAGEQVLDGENALKYVRYRHGYVEGDIGRIKAQQEFLKEAAKQIINPANITKAFSFVSIATQNTKTDFPVFEATAVVIKLFGINSDNIEFALMEGESHYVNGISYFMPDVDKLLVTVNSHFNKTATPITKEDIKLKNYTAPPKNPSNGNSSNNGSNKPQNNNDETDSTPDETPVEPPNTEPGTDNETEPGTTPDTDTDDEILDDENAHNEPDPKDDEGNSQTGEAPAE